MSVGCGQGGRAQPCAETWACGCRRSSQRLSLSAASSRLRRRCGGSVVWPWAWTGHACGVDHSRSQEPQESAPGPPGHSVHTRACHWETTVLTRESLTFLCGLPHFPFSNRKCCTPVGGRALGKCRVWLAAGEALWSSHPRWPCARRRSPLGWSRPSLPSSLVRVTLQGALPATSVPRANPIVSSSGGSVARRGSSGLGGPAAALDSLPVMQGIQHRVS